MSCFSFLFLLSIFIFAYALNLCNGGYIKSVISGDVWAGLGSVGWDIYIDMRRWATLFILFTYFLFFFCSSFGGNFPPLLFFLFSFFQSFFLYVLFPLFFHYCAMPNTEKGFRRGKFGALAKAVFFWMSCLYRRFFSCFLLSKGP